MGDFKIVKTNLTQKWLQVQQMCVDLDKVKPILRTHISTVITPTLVTWKVRMVYIASSITSTRVTCIMP